MNSDAYGTLANPPENGCRRRPGSRRAGRTWADYELRQPWRPERYSDGFVTLGAALGMARVPLHGSRHCAASLLADLGVPTSRSRRASVTPGSP